MDKKRVSEILEEMGTILELQGANPFRTRAFHNGAIIISGVTEDLKQLVAEDRLTDIDGIGRGLAGIIKELVETGSSSEYQELRFSLPPGLLEIVKIPGLGPKRVRILYERLGIESVADLKAAAEQHRLSEVEGFGEKTEANILKGIERLSKSSDKHYIHKAFQVAEEVFQILKKRQDVGQCEIAGSLRRRKEVIGDIDIVVSASKGDRQAIMSAFVEKAERIIGQGDTKSSIVVSGGINCDLRIVEESEFPFALNYFTGSKEHNVEMRSLARKKGWSLNEYAFSPLEENNKAKKVPRCRDETELYAFLGLSYIPPELRENLGEFDAARDGTLPELVTLNDLQGTFHCHTTYSDGSNTLEETTNAARAKGWKYWGVSDHSRAAAYAGGMTQQKAKAQLKEIDRLNASSGDMRIFKGIECDILGDGTLDFSDKVLAGYEFVIGSIHSRFNMTESEGTRRLLKAVKNKHVTMIGHPTGRLLLSRDGYPVNMTEIIQAAADYGKVLEINAHPYRLDLDWRLVKIAREKGVMLAINPDAHNTDGLDDVQYGIGVARKGWLEKKNVLNALPVQKVEAFFRKSK